MPDFIDSVFVYGTLKRGQCRETAWPAKPQAIQTGWVRGELYGRDDYPALIQGNYRVHGEIWIFDRASMKQVLAVLDAVEETCGNQPTDLYHRLVVLAHASDGQAARNCFAYYYNRDPNADGFVAMPQMDGAQSWPL